MFHLLLQINDDKNATANAGPSTTENRWSGAARVSYQPSTSDRQLRGDGN